MIAGHDADWSGGRWRPSDGLDLAGRAGVRRCPGMRLMRRSRRREGRRAGGKLPPHVMVYFAMALALFAEDDYEEVAARLTETLQAWGAGMSWEVPTSGGITQARQRLGPEPLERAVDRVAEPVAGLLTRGAFLRHWRLMAIDGFELDVPDTPANAAAFGYASGENRSAFPNVRVVTIGERGSHRKSPRRWARSAGRAACRPRTGPGLLPAVGRGNR